MPDLQSATQAPGTEACRADRPCRAPGQRASEHLFGRHFWMLSAGGTLVSALMIGVPTVLVPNSLFVRMTSTSARDYVVWTLATVLLGPLIALSLLYPSISIQETLRHVGSGNWRSAVGGLLAFLSVGCPICNKIVVVLLGVSGALTVFDPLRPYLGLAALTVLSTTLFLRVRALLWGCPLPPASPSTHTATPQ